MNAFEAQVAEALAAVTVHRSGSIAWCGRRIGRPPSRALEADARTAYTVAVLEDVLYESFYCRGAAIPSTDDGSMPAHRRDAAFVEQLSAANAGRGGWAPGWRIDGSRRDRLLVSKDGLTLVARRSQVRTRRAKPEIGSPAEIRLPKERRAASPGFYMAVGDSDLGPRSERPLLRLYFHVVAAAAVPLMAGVTAWLNQARIAFRLKVVDVPARFTRCDAAVLYVGARDFDGVRPMLRDLEVAMRERTPAFTKPLARGIGLAEDPSTGESFGAHRCRLLAEAIVEAHRLGLRRPGDRLAAVKAHFATHAVDLSAPYLEPASHDRYTL